MTDAEDGKGVRDVLDEEPAVLEVEEQPEVLRDRRGQQKARRTNVAALAVEFYESCQRPIHERRGDDDEGEAICSPCVEEQTRGDQEITPPLNRADDVCKNQEWQEPE